MLELTKRQITKPSLAEDSETQRSGQRGRFEIASQGIKLKRESHTR